MKDMQEMFTDIANDKKHYSEMARDVLVDLLRQGVEEEKHKNGYEFKEEDVSELVDFVLEQINNTSKKLNGKETQCSYQPLTFQMAYAIWSRSPASYCEQKVISPLVLPSESQMRKVKQANKCKDGEDIMVYQLRMAERI